MKKILLLHFLNLFQSKQLGHDHLVVVMQMLILPMLAHAFQNDQSWEVVDPAIIKTIVDKLLDPPEEVISCFVSFSSLSLFFFTIAFCPFNFQIQSWTYSCFLFYSLTFWCLCHRFLLNMMSL